MPDQTTDSNLGRVRLPAIARSPFWELGRRMLIAAGILSLTVLIVYAQRSGYNDTADPSHRVDFLDAVYFTAVTMSSSFS